MKRLQEKFKQAAHFLENNDTPVRQYIYLFLAILSVRLCLEFFANQKLFTFHDALHIALWFTFIVLAFMAQVHLFSRVEMSKIFKLSVSCFSIALIAPIVDLAVSHGQSSKMNYLSIHSVSDFIFSYFTVGGASLTRGATIGIRVEIILLMIACFNYLYTRRGSLLIAFLGSFSIYTVLFLSGTLPAAINAFVQYFQLGYALEDHTTELLLFLLDLLLVVFIAARISGKKIWSFVHRETLIDWSFCVLSLGYGIWQARENYPQNWSLNASTIFFFPLLLVLFLLLFFYVNHKQHTARTGGQTSPFFEGFWLLFFSGTWMISFHALFAALLSWSMLFVLYDKPTRWHRYQVSLVLFKSLFYTSCVLLGFMSFGAPLVGINVVHLTLILLLFIGLSALRVLTARV